jgi:predicted ATP-binding protein involved in virulence
MRLDRLHIQNFRCYEDATFDFQPGFNLVVGVNGSGKTSLLQAVASSFIEFGQTFSHHEDLLTKESVRFVFNEFEKRTRFERVFPLVLEAKGDLLGSSGWDVHWLAADHRMLDTRPSSKALEVINSVSSESTTDLPLLGFYRANRRWKMLGVAAEFAAKQRVSRLDGYSNWFDTVTDLKEFETWLISKTLERMQNVLDAGIGATLVGEDELAWVNRAIQIALPEARDLRYDLRSQTLLIQLEKTTFPFSELSDGQRGMVALFADIARRMCILNPHMGKDVLKNTSGVIIIDELDIHLHPAWQRSIVSALRNAFPRVQFIAASHSPQIIGSLRPEEVILLNNGDSPHPRVTFGLDSSKVLEEVMGVAQREPEIEELLSELFSTLENNELDKAKSLLQALKEKAPDLPEFLRAEALMRRKEIIGR